MSRRNLNRRRVLQGAGVGIAAATAGCLPGGGDGQGQDGQDGQDGSPTPTQDPANLPPVHHITDYWNPLWEKKWNEEAQAFESETGIAVNVEEVGMSGEQESRLAQLVQAGDPPDANTSTFDQVANLWANDQLTPANDVAQDIQEVNGDRLTDPFIPENGNLFQISHGMYVSNFHYRADIFGKLGLSEPENFDDVVENARAIDEAEGDIRGYGLAGGKTGKSQDEFQVYLSQMGTSGVGLRWKDPDAMNELEIHFPEDKVKRLLQFFKDLSQYSPDPTSIGWGETFSRYLQGQFAQQYHLNIWPQGVAAQQAMGDGPDALGGLAKATNIMALPLAEGAENTWLFEPAPDGYHLLKNGSNTPGAKEWFRHLYANSVEKTASMYAQEPSRFLPTYADVKDSDTYQGFEIWSQYPKLLEDMSYCQDTIMADIYGQVPQSDLNSPVALFVTRQWFYGEMVNRVVTDSMSIQEAYDWGLGRLEQRFQEGKDKFG